VGVHVGAGVGVDVAVGVGVGSSMGLTTDVAVAVDVGVGGSTLRLLSGLRAGLGTDSAEGCATGVRSGEVISGMYTRRTDGGRDRPGTLGSWRAWRARTGLGVGSNASASRWRTRKVTTATSARTIKLSTSRPRQERGLVIARSNSNRILLINGHSIHQLSPIVKSDSGVSCFFAAGPLDPIGGWWYDVGSSGHYAYRGQGRDKR